MPCAGCYGARTQLYGSARRGDVRGMAQAVSRAVAINYDKLRGVDVNAKYGNLYPNARPATPYRRPDAPERTK